ncbi:MAG: sterol desaturase family protein [Beijerinckiaceae bacterium]
MLRNFLLHGSNTALIAFTCVLLGTAAAGWLDLPLWLVVLGALLFFLTEYGTHRFVFHGKPARWAWLRAKQHRLHYDHHMDPARLDLLFLPLWYVVPNLIVVAAIAYAILRDAGQVAALLLGAMLALLYYEWVHFIAHQPYEPKTGMGRWMKRYHLRHHFVNEKLWFGVSNPSMDLICGTFGGPDDTKRSRTTRVLFPGEQAPK